MIIHFKNESTLTVAGIKKQFIVKLIKKVAKENIVIHVKHNQPEQSQNFCDALVRWKVVTVIQLIRNNANQFLGKKKKHCQPVPRKEQETIPAIFLGKNKKQTKLNNTSD